MSAVCIIPARGGSQRIPKKNVREFHGKPIIQYSIEAALEAEIFDDIYVSTDSAEFSEIAEKLGAGVLMRPKELADAETGTQAVMAHELTRLRDIQYGNIATFTCCLYACAPMVESYELRRAHAYLKLDKKIDYMVPVAEWLKDPGRWYFGKTSAFMNETPLIGQGTRLMKIDPKRAIDINIEEDWVKAESMYEQLHK